mgnify:FL=1
MKKKAFCFQTVFILLLLFLPQLQAQQEEIIRLELSGGSVLLGTILSEDSTHINFLTNSNLQIKVNKNIIS